MKMIKTSFAILGVAFLGIMSGCAAFSQDKHPVTQTSYSGDKELQFWADRSARIAKSQEWQRNEQVLSRMRHAEYTNW